MNVDGCRRGVEWVADGVVCVACRVDGVGSCRRARWDVVSGSS